LHEVGHAIDYGLGEYRFGTGGKALSSHSNFTGAYKKLIAGARLNESGNSSLDPYLMHGSLAQEGEAHNSANGIREAFAQMFQMRQLARNQLGKSASNTEINAFAARRFISEHLDEGKGFDEAQVQGAAVSMARYLQSVDDALAQVTAAPDGGIPDAPESAPVTRSSLLRSPTNDWARSAPASATPATTPPVVPMGGTYRRRRPRTSASGSRSRSRRGQGPSRHARQRARLRGVASGGVKLVALVLRARSRRVSRPWPQLATAAITPLPVEDAGVAAPPIVQPPCVDLSDQTSFLAAGTRQWR
jgi:hypothetical protein